jgi:hypothetical protein
MKKIGLNILRPLISLETKHFQREKAILKHINFSWCMTESLEWFKMPHSNLIDSKQGGTAHTLQWLSIHRPNESALKGMLYITLSFKFVCHCPQLSYRCIQVQCRKLQDTEWLKRKRLKYGMLKEYALIFETRAAQVHQDPHGRNRWNGCCLWWSVHWAWWWIEKTYLIDIEFGVVSSQVIMGVYVIT